MCDVLRVCACHVTPVVTDCRDSTVGSNNRRDKRIARRGTYPSSDALGRSTRSTSTKLNVVAGGRHLPPLENPLRKHVRRLGQLYHRQQILGAGFSDCEARPKARDVTP